MGTVPTTLRALVLATACACEPVLLEQSIEPDPVLLRIDELVALHAANTEPTTWQADGGYLPGTSACSLLLMLWLQDTTKTWDEIQAGRWRALAPAEVVEEGNEDCVWLTAGPPYHARDQPR